MLTNLQEHQWYERLTGATSKEGEDPINRFDKCVAKDETGEFVSIKFKPVFEEWHELRQRCTRELFWFAKDILQYHLVDNFFCRLHPAQMREASGVCPLCKMEMEWYSQIPGQRSLHREICDFFVHKDPTKPLHGQDTVKNRLLMCPRGSFKSSCDEADAVQWIIAFPQVRIGLLTAAEDLGHAFLSKVKDFFTVKGKDSESFTYTKFQLLFPEHCLSEKDAAKQAADEFTTPARPYFIKEPSLHAISIGKTKSGWHYDVGKYDDCVSDKNSGPSSTQEARDTVGSNIRLARALVEPAGYHDNIGTPYDEKDAYSYQLQAAKPGALKTLIRSAWTRKETSLRKKEDDCTADDYYLLFPFDGNGVPRHTFEFLQSVLNDDPFIFACQYLCRPSATRRVKFTEAILRQHVVQAEGLPVCAKIFAAWDFAYSTEKGRDFSVGCVGFFAQNRCFVMEIVRGRFSKSELAYNVAALAKRWGVEKTYIENSPGAVFLENDIFREMTRLNYSTTGNAIEWFPVDNSKDAKEARAEGLEMLLIEGRLWFSANIAIMDQVIREFVLFKPASRRKDDIIDSIAHLTTHAMPPFEIVPETEAERQQAAWDTLAQKELYDLVYGVRENIALVNQDAPSPAPPDIREQPLTMDGTPVACSSCGFPPGFCICCR